MLNFCHAVQRSGKAGMINIKASIIPKRARLRTDHPSPKTIRKLTDVYSLGSLVDSFCQHYANRPLKYF